MANNRLLVTLEAKDKLTNTINGAKDAIKDMKNEMNKAGKAASSLDDYEKKFNKIITSSGAVEQKLKQLQRLASDMEFKGLSGTDLFTKVVSQAGAAKDAISDARTAISKFSDDNMKLTASIQGFSTLAAAGTTLAGVMGLVGAKSDEVAQAILKVQSALSILNGIQQIANNLNKESALMQRIRQIQMEDSAAKEAGESIGKLASERLRDANALKGLTAARAANTKGVATDTTATGANTGSQGVNTEAVGVNTTANAANTDAMATNTGAVVVNTKARNGENVAIHTFTQEMPAAIAAAAEDAKFARMLAVAKEKHAMTQEQLNVAIAEYNALIGKGQIQGAANAAFEAGAKSVGAFRAGLQKTVTWLNTVSKALLGVKAATAGWIALAAGAVILIYKLATAEDEYVKELNEEAEKLQESIDRQKNMTAEQQKAKAHVEALKRAQEELNAVREREKNYISTVGSTFSNLIISYKKLSNEYSQLRNNHEKLNWIKNNQNAFNSLGVSVKSVTDAENVFKNMTADVIEGFKLRAKAAAQAALAVEKYKKALELETESTSTGMRGATVTVDQANRLPEELRNKLIKNTHQERNTGPMSMTEMYQSQYTGGRGTHTVLDSYTVPMDASEDFLKKLAAHGFTAKKRAAEAKKAYEEAENYMDQSLETEKKAAQKLKNTGVPSAQDKPTNTTPKPEKPKTNLEQMEAQLKKLQDERVNIDISAPNADAQIADINRRIKAKEKEIKDYKIKVGAEVDTTPVEGSLEWINAKISELETGLRKNKLPVGVSVEDAKRQIEQFKKQQEQEEVKLGLKVVPEIGSIAEMQKKISDINTQLQNKNLSLPMRIELLTQQQDLQRQIAEKTQGTLTIPAKIEPQVTRTKGDLFDLRESRQNAQNAINQIVSDFEAGIIKSKEEAEKAIKEINDKLEELGEKKIEVKIGAKGISKTIQGIESVASSAADAFSAIAEASETPELNVAATIAGGIASVIQGYGQATAQASSLGPWAWIAFGLAATAQLVSMIAAISQASAGAQGYAQGGIVTGASSHGDALGINVNAGEMVLTKQQQGKLWNTINDNRTEPNRYFDTPRIVGKIRGRDMVLMMQNESKMKNKAGLSLNIS